MLKQRRDPRRCPDAVTFEVSPKWKECLIGLSGARARVQERKEELLIETYVRVAIMPVERRDHVELGAAAVARIAPRDERRFAVLAVPDEIKRIHEKRRVPAPSVVKEWNERRVALVRTPKAVEKREEM